MQKKYQFGILIKMERLLLSIMKKLNEDKIKHYYGKHGNIHPLILQNDKNTIIRKYLKILHI